MTVRLSVFVNEINRSVLICYTDMTEMNTTFIANGVLQFSFNTAIRGPSKCTQRFVFFTLLSFFYFYLMCCCTVVYSLVLFLFVLLSVHIHRGAWRSWHLIQDPADVTGNVGRALLVHLNERVSLEMEEKSLFKQFLH